jgi:hypothetical protein
MCLTIWAFPGLPGELLDTPLVNGNRVVRRKEVVLDPPPSPFKDHQGRGAVVLVTTGVGSLLRNVPAPVELVNLWIDT